MREEDKPFVCYKSRWSLKIQPRNATGWKLSFLWLLAMLPQTGLFMWAMGRHPGGGLAAVYTLLYTAAMALWGWRMVVWMKARSEIFDMDELLAIKRQQDQQARRKGR
ncbi:hypothetical protein [Novosphingobium sp. TH158]|uniref:hypothetical protein n=1 Tax=Novosphingobium sp. TH158 TaxID=2067455 RepID=UPI000C7D3E56|nr:hypothetical protein [Novosphingobium sp. TH158]PLK27355.1 hypothetical protein C0V78_11005 [Novosphingobium sp. TH158]